MAARAPRDPERERMRKLQSLFDRAMTSLEVALPVALFGGGLTPATAEALRAQELDELFSVWRRMQACEKRRLGQQQEQQQQHPVPTPAAPATDTAAIVLPPPPPLVLRRPPGLPLPPKRPAPGEAAGGAGAGTPSKRARAGNAGSGNALSQLAAAAALRAEESK